MTPQSRSKLMTMPRKTKMTPQSLYSYVLWRYTRPEVLH